MTTTLSFLTYRDKLEAIHEVERNANVNALNIQGIKVWPLIRMLVWRKLLHPEQDVFRSIQDVFRKPQLIYTSENIGASTLDVLFHCRPEDNTDRIEGCFYNRHLDPWFELFSKKFQCEKFEIASDLTIKTWPRFKPTVLFQPPHGIYDELSKFKIENWTSFKHEADEILGFNVEEATTLSFYQTVSLYHDYFIEILKQKKPRAVFLICWYFEVNMALAWACRELGIACVDVQHGKQGKYHGMYSHWTIVPKDGYEFMPTHFLTWGQESSENILKWFPHQSGLPEVVVGGNLWLSQWLEGIHPSPGSEYARLVSRAQKYRKIILVSLQPIEDPLPKYLIQVIRFTSDNILWLIRMHPVHRKQRNQILNQLGLLPCSLDLDASSELPLYALLRICTHHLTGFSSVGYEALHFKIPTGMWHPVAEEMYGNEFKKGAFVKVDSQFSIEKFLIKDFIESQFNTEYILTDKVAALKIGTEIVEWSKSSPNILSWSAISRPFAEATLLSNEPGQLVFESIRCVREFGLAIIPGFLNGILFEKIKNEFEMALTNEPSSIYPFGKATRIECLEQYFLRYPAVIELFNNSFMKIIAELYFDEPFNFNQSVYFTHETHSDQGMGLNGYLHFDRNHSLKFFFYLMNTSLNNGALSCVPKSHVIGHSLREDAWLKDGTYDKVKNQIQDYPHLEIGESNIIPIEESAGTLIIFDTDLFHRNGIVKAGLERKVLRGHCYPKRDLSLSGKRY